MDPIARCSPTCSWIRKNSDRLSLTGQILANPATIGPINLAEWAFSGICGLLLDFTDFNGSSGCGDSDNCIGWSQFASDP